MDSAGFGSVQGDFLPRRIKIKQGLIIAIMIPCHLGIHRGRRPSILRFLIISYCFLLFFVKVCFFDHVLVDVCNTFSVLVVYVIRSVVDSTFAGGFHTRRF